MCVLIFSTNLPQTSPILRALSKILLKMYMGIRVKDPSFLSNFNETWISATVLRKILKHNFSWKSAQIEPSCSMRTDRQTDKTKLIFAFDNIVNAPQNSTIHRLCLWRQCTALKRRLPFTSRYGVTCHMTWISFRLFLLELTLLLLSEYVSVCPLSDDVLSNSKSKTSNERRDVKGNDRGLFKFVHLPVAAEENHRNVPR